MTSSRVVTSFFGKTENPISPWMLILLHGVAWGCFQRFVWKAFVWRCAPLMNTSARCAWYRRGLLKLLPTNGCRYMGFETFGGCGSSYFPGFRVPPLGTVQHLRQHTSSDECMSSAGFLGSRNFSKATIFVVRPPLRHILEKMGSEIHPCHTVSGTLS